MSGASPLRILISNRQRAEKIDSRLLKKIIATALDELKVQKAELGIVLVSAREIALLNEEFLGHEGPTDVITFDYRSTVRHPRARRLGAGDSGPRTELHGEIFICVEEAHRQSRQFATTWREEIARYIVHGILHLIGYDDLQAAARSRMKRIEGRLAGQLSRRFALGK